MNCKLSDIQRNLSINSVGKKAYEKHLEVIKKFGTGCSTYENVSSIAVIDSCFYNIRIFLKDKIKKLLKETFKISRQTGKYNIIRLEMIKGQIQLLEELVK